MSEEEIKDIENLKASEVENDSENNAESDTDNLDGTNSPPSTESRPQITIEDLPSLFEALLFVAGSPITLSKLCALSKFDEREARDALDVLKNSLESRVAPIELIEVNEGFQLRTKEFFAPFIQDFKKSKPKRLSAPALETLAVVAYRQPVVKSDIEAIRGVDVTPTLKTLLDRKLVRIIGYQATVGQPALYGTTDQFLELFGLKSLTELPALKDLKELSEDPGEGGLDSDHEDVESEDTDLSIGQLVDDQVTEQKAANE